LSSENLVDILSGAFNTFEIAVESGALIGLERAMPIFTISGLNAGLELKDFNKTSAKASLNYQHSGFSAAELEAELAPEVVNINVNLSQIPWRAVLSGAITEDLGTMLLALKDNETKLNVETVSVSLPDAKIDITGVGYLNAFDPEAGPPEFKAQVQAETLNLVSWAESMRTHMPQRDVNDFNQVMAIVMLVAEQVEENLHRFNIDINSLGELWINEKDMSSLIQ